MNFDVNKLMEQAQDMQDKLKDQMDNLELEATAGGGMVKVTMNGNKEVLSIELEKDVVDPEDVEMLEDLIMAAVNEATRQVDEKLEDEMGGLPGGMDIPGL